MRLGMLVLALMPLVASAASAQPSFDPRAYQRRLVGQPTQVLVLGTPHLSGTPKDWDPSVLEPLLSKLAAFRPEVITIEALPGRTIRSLWDYRAVFGETGTSYGGRAMILSQAGSVGTGMDGAEAEAEVRRQLRAWPAAPSPAQRRRLAALFATAGDPHSALVQWWRLAAGERRAEDGVHPTLMAQLNEYDQRKNENHLIGARLAVRLGLERVHPTDSQDDDTLSPDQMKIFASEIFEPMVEEFKSDPRLKPMMEATEHLRNGEEVLETYRMMNQPATGRAQADLEWGRMLDRPTKENVGRRRTSGWEVRNLRMAANVREATAAVPGGRVLVIVGAGHKPWLEAYLGMMGDVKLVDAQAVLR